MEKKTKIIYPIFLSLALLAGICIGIFLDFPRPGLGMSQSDVKEHKLRQIISYIEYEYVEEINTDSILDLTISELLTKLDPHSSYIPSDMVASNEEGIKGSFDGIGIEFKMFRDTLTVVRVIKDGPSERAGLKEGDRILTAGEKPLFGSGIAPREIVSTLKGESGTSVALNVYRPSSNTTNLINVKRDEVPLHSLQSSFVLDGDVGYVKLVRFSQNSGEELENELKALKRKGAKKLILDLRDNPGGLLSSAREVADAFLDDGKLIVFTKNRQGDENRIYASADGGFEKGDMVVLINEASASASEIVAGALQDNDRAWIVGRRSFGKGLVQEEMRLQDGSRLRLTTRRYFTPSGRSIQKPYEKYDHKFMEKSGFEGQSSSVDTTNVYHTSSGREVYGGGGIMPDVIVPMDTSNSAAFMHHLLLVSDFDEKAFAYVDRNREALKEWSELDFMKNFRVDENILEHFFGSNLSRIKSQPEKSLALIRARIKSYIGYNLYGNSAFQQSYAEHDPMIRSALKTLKSEFD